MNNVKNITDEHIVLINSGIFITGSMYNDAYKTLTDTGMPSMYVLDYFKYPVDEKEN